MSRKKVVSIEGPPAVVREHQAVEAWAKVSSTAAGVARVDILKQGRSRRSRRGVYRLVDALGQGRHIIAKLCDDQSAFTEQTVYRKILDALPVRTPRHYGLLLVEGAPLAWLFMEDVAGQSYEPSNRDHRILAAKWMANVHTAAASLCEQAELPLRSANHYVHTMELGRRRIQEHWRNPALGTDDLALLASILNDWDTLMGYWPLIDDFCANAPQTLVHGDLVKKNIRVCATDIGLDFMPFDWGMTAGVGPPAADLIQSFGVRPDLGVYHEAVAEYWPNLQHQDVHFLSVIGDVFRSIAAVEWESRRLEFKWVRSAMCNLAVYQEVCGDALRLLVEVR